jgi:hypothetical protein
MHQLLQPRKVDTTLAKCRISVGQNLPVSLFLAEHQARQQGAEEHNQDQQLHTETHPGPAASSHSWIAVL